MEQKASSMRRLRFGLTPDRGFLVCLAVSLAVTIVVLAAASRFPAPEPDPDGFVLAGAEAHGVGGPGDGPVIAVLGGTGQKSGSSNGGSGGAVGWYHRIAGWVRADQVVRSEVLGTLPRIDETPHVSPPTHDPGQAQCHEPAPAIDADPVRDHVQLLEQSFLPSPVCVCVMVSASASLN
jgi:hypothetical protein